MRADILENEVLSKCEVLKKARFWLPEPIIRPRAWLENFDREDRLLAARLLDRFTFFSSLQMDKLLLAAYDSLCDGFPRGSAAPTRDTLRRSLAGAVFTPVKGERPNPSDSGYLLCRKARQLFGLTESSIVETDAAVSHASNGGAVIFVDDFVGSGDQFISTWQRDFSSRSFATESRSSDFIAIYICIVAMQSGLEAIGRAAPTVAVSCAHIVKEKSSVFGICSGDSELRRSIDALLTKYAMRLTPREPYISANPTYLKYGYKERGLMLGFEHSIPDATLPIFWSPGTNSWEPLIERT